MQRLWPGWVNVDLPQLCRQLGVALVGGSVVFDDSAPLAPIRRAMTMRREGKGATLR